MAVFKALPALLCSLSIEGSAIAEMPQEMIPSDLTWRVPLKPHPLPLVSYPYTPFSSVQSLCNG
jgi:hypothetical protein